MSRLIRYKESLSKFINDKSSIFKSLPDRSVEPYLYNKIKESDFVLPILFLTTMNSQNKKNRVSMQGYYAASAVEMLYLLLDIINDQDRFVEVYGHSTYSTITTYLLITIQSTICQNLESINRFLAKDISGGVFLGVFTYYSSAVSYDTILGKCEIELSDNCPHPDLLKWYLNDDPELREKFNTIKQVNRESLTNYITKKIGCLCEVAICLGWLMGCGEQKDLNKVKKISKYFAMFYQLSNNFQTISQDITESKNGVCYNYVVNFGLQDSYELFMYNKEKFIEETMMLDIYTNTVKEIVDHIEGKVDIIIDETEPDIKSNYSVKN